MNIISVPAFVSFAIPTKRPLLLRLLLPFKP